MHKDNAELVIAYLFQRLPNRFSLDTLTRLIYLADWISAVKYSNVIFSPNWIINVTGPDTNSIGHIIDDQMKDMAILSLESENGIDKVHVSLRHTYKLKSVFRGPIRLGLLKEAVLKQVFDVYETQSEQEFNRIVFSSLPCYLVTETSSIDLLEEAENYRRMKKLHVPGEIKLAASGLNSPAW